VARQAAEGAESGGGGFHGGPRYARLLVELSTGRGTVGELRDPIEGLSTGS
jgi:hypothetical protein